MNHWLRLRLLLLPFGMVAELGVIAACWLLARFSPRQSDRIMGWAVDTLPETRWYFGE